MFYFEAEDHYVAQAGLGISWAWWYMTVILELGSRSAAC